MKPFRLALRRAKAKLLLDALKAEGGNRTRAARRLGYSGTADLSRAIKTLRLPVPKGKPGRPKKT